MIEPTDSDAIELMCLDVSEPTSAAVDLALLLSFAEAQGEGEPDLIVGLIDLYLADTPHRLAAIRAAGAAADGLALKRAAHNLKGSSANLGARQVAALCAELERADSNDPCQISVFLIRLEQAFEHVRQVFTAERQKRT